MRIAFRKIVITPQKPCMQAGYVQRTHEYTEVHDDIYSTVFVITNSNSRFVWIGADVVCFNKQFVAMLKQQLNEKGISLDDSSLVIGATHDHSSASTNLVDDDYGKANREYAEYLCGLYVDTITELWNQEGEEVTARYCSAVIDGLYSNRNDANKLSDKVVHLLGFFREDRPLAVFCNLACHNTALGPDNYRLSSEIFGMARIHLEERIGGTFMMTNSNAGDMGNRQYRTGQQFKDAELMAWNLADQIVRKHTPWTDVCMEHVSHKHIEFHKTIMLDSSIYIPKIADFEERLKHTDDLTERKVLLSGIAGFRVKMKYGDGPKELVMPADIFTFEDLQIVAVPGELGSVLGLGIKAASKKPHCILWGYVGACDLGYMVDEEAYRLECQETNTTIYPCGTPEEYRDFIISNL